MKSVASSNAGGVSVTYDYDELNRLKTATDGSGSTQYHYDAVVNLDNYTYPNGVQHKYTYDERLPPAFLVFPCLSASGQHRSPPGHLP